jgi:hypothetical protein
MKRGAFATLLLATGVAVAQAPQLPPPDTVSLDALGYMSTFPPKPEQLVDNGNRGKYPQMRWVLQHTREVVPTRNIRRGNGTPSASLLPRRTWTATASKTTRARRSPSPTGSKASTPTPSSCCTGAA